MHAYRAVVDELQITKLMARAVLDRAKVWTSTQPAGASDKGWRGSTGVANPGIELLDMRVGLKGRAPCSPGLTFCYLLTAQTHRDGDTWRVHLLDAKAQGSMPDYMIADAGQGARLDQQIALADASCHGDVFHIQHQLQSRAKPSPASQWDAHSNRAAEFGPCVAGDCNGLCDNREAPSDEARSRRSGSNNARWSLEHSGQPMLGE